MAVRSPQRMAEFYGDVLGLEIVRETSSPLMGDAVLLSGGPAEGDHELVCFTNPQAEHVAFRVQTPGELETLYRRARQRGVQVHYALDSGVARSFFIRDPENKALEIYFAPGEPRRDKPPLTDARAISRLILGG